MHRDVKPGNVVVDPHGLAHLIDFGIARKTGDATMTQTGFVLGTPDFLAPEIACGERASPASDAWQLAATISYALTGHPPRGGTPTRPPARGRRPPAPRHPAPAHRTRRAGRRWITTRRVVRPCGGTARAGGVAAAPPARPAPTGRCAAV
jgi:serine/threonine protein kinase